MNKQIYLLLFVVLGFECILRPCVRDAILYENTNREKRQKRNYVRNQPLWRKILYVFPIKDHEDRGRFPVLTNEDKEPSPVFIEKWLRMNR